MERLKSNLLIDVRSPAEYRKGHIPGAFNLPLFSDEERKEIGTLYKQQSSWHAIQKGMELAVPKSDDLTKQIQEISDGRSPVIYCWRGGMRSQAVTRLLSEKGIDAEQLQGGYKAFRRSCEKIFSLPMNLQVLSGLSGCGKTEKLRELKEAGEQTIDLEALADHRGGCFGHIGMGQQPTTEHFHNKIAWELSGFDFEKTIWIENESRTLGSCHLPEALFKQMRQAPIETLHCAMEHRLENLYRDYGNANPEEWISAVRKLQKRLGLEKTKIIIEHIRGGRLREAALGVLDYYDQSYLRP